MIIDRVAQDLYRVEAPHFIAGVLVDWNTGRINETAPIIRYMVGDHIDDLKQKCKEREWSLRLIPHKGYEDQYRETLRVLRKTRLWDERESSTGD